MKSKYDYTALDTAILARLAKGPVGFSGFREGDVHKEALALEAQDKAQLTGPYRLARPAFRFIDARLQALRKAKKISFDKVWHIATD